MRLPNKQYETLYEGEAMTTPRDTELEKLAGKIKEVMGVLPSEYSYRAQALAAFIRENYVEKVALNGAAIGWAHAVERESALVKEVERLREALKRILRHCPLSRPKGASSNIPRTCACCDMSETADGRERHYLSCHFDEARRAVEDLERSRRVQEKP